MIGQDAGEENLFWIRVLNMSLVIDIGPVTGATEAVCKFCLLLWNPIHRTIEGNIRQPG
jgi:hypothetical protein